MKPPSPGTPLRAAIAGCGEVTEFKHLVAVSQMREVMVDTLVDLDRERVERVAGKFGIRRAVTDYREVLDDPVIDALLVSTPPGTHVPIALDALSAGKHVLVEKPLSLDLAEAEKLESAAAVSPLVAMMGFHMRFHRIIRAGRERLPAVGPVDTVRAVWCAPRVDAGLPSWRFRRTSGGGALTEIGVHLFDLVRYLLREDPVEITAVSKNGTRDDEAAQAMLRMASGAVVALTLSERAPHQCGLEFMGAGGRLMLDCHRFDGCEVIPERGHASKPATRLRGLAATVKQLPHALASLRNGGDYVQSYGEEWRHFAAVIRGEAKLESTISDGVAAVRMVNRAIGSLRHQALGATP